MKIEMEVELLQPWSTFVMKTKLPPPILEKMIRITDEIVKHGNRDYTLGAGQLENQFYIGLEILEREELMEFFLQACKNYVIQAYYQAQPNNKENILKEEWLTQMTTLWINSQRDNEYFPTHIHTNCTLSSVMYLKIPEYLPSRKSYSTFEEDGAIEFSNNSSTDKIWGYGNFLINPEEGDFFIFPATQRHQVYPFRTVDGKGERRSVSFNANFTSKSEQDTLRNYRRAKRQYDGNLRRKATKKKGWDHDQL